MLEHEPRQDQGPGQAANTRVTAEEFAAAIDAVERRKAAERERLASTVPIGQTIDELRIDATPDEILREVEAQRIAKRGQAPPKAAPPDSKEARERAATEADEKWRAARIEAKKGIAAATVLASALAQDAAEAYQKHRASRGAAPIFGSRPSKRRRVLLKLLGVGLAFAVLSSMGVFDGHWNISLPPPPTAVIYQGPPVTNVPLSQITNGQTLYCDSVGVEKILQSGGEIDSKDSSVILTSDSQTGNWSIQNHAGELYLHAYTKLVGINELGVGQIDLYTGDSPVTDNDSYSEVVVPLRGAEFVGMDNTEDWSKMTVKNISVDQYTQVQDHH